MATPSAPEDSSPAVPSEARAWRSPAAIIFLLLVIALSLAIDLASKHCVFSRLLSDQSAQAQADRIRLEDGTDPQVHEYVMGRYFHTRAVLGVRLRLSTNKGVVFGMELHDRQTVHRLIVAAMTVIVTGIVLVLFANTHKRDHAMHVALGLILGGALGNLYDRMFSSVAVNGFAPLENRVRDFIDASDLGYPWIFNLADVWLVIGVAIVILHWLVTERKRSRQHADRAADA